VTQSFGELAKKKSFGETAELATELTKKNIKKKILYAMLTRMPTLI
jgi:hypothetical protein